MLAVTVCMLLLILVVAASCVPVVAVLLSWCGLLIVLVFLRRRVTFLCSHFLSYALHATRVVKISLVIRVDVIGHALQRRCARWLDVARDEGVRDVAL